MSPKRKEGHVAKQTVVVRVELGVVGLNKNKLHSIDIQSVTLIEIEHQLFTTA